MLGWLIEAWRVCVCVCVGVGGSPIFIETSYAWYILGDPASQYRAFYAPFYNAHKIAQHLVSTALAAPDTTYSQFVEDLPADVNQRRIKHEEIRNAVRACLCPPHPRTN